MQQTSGYAVAGCPVQLHERRYDWRHDLILLNIAKLVKAISLKEQAADIGDETHRQLQEIQARLAIVNDELPDIAEMTVTFEINIDRNGQGKKEKYTDLTDKTRTLDYKEVISANLTMC